MRFRNRGDFVQWASARADRATSGGIGLMEIHARGSALHRWDFIVQARL
jgi:hypothetical protein